MALKRIENGTSSKAVFKPEANILQNKEEVTKIEEENKKLELENESKEVSYCLRIISSQKTEYEIFCKKRHITLKDFILGSMAYTKEMVEKNELVLTKCNFKQKLI